LHVAITNISKGNVCPYIGKEIPEYEQLGLDPKKIYKLLRHPEELARAASSFNNQPVLSEHVPVTAQDYDEKVKKFTIGSTGTDATFELPFLKNSLVIWSGKAIKAIESGDQKEISSGYHYRADMTPGTFEGEHYDGVMRDIVGNHVAIVEEGRAGPDVVVGDSKENLMTPTRFAAIVLNTVVGGMPPMLAKDAKLDIKPFRGLTRANFTERRPALDAAIRRAVKGRLAKDANPKQLIELLDAFETAENDGGYEGLDEPVSEPQRRAMWAAASGHSTLGIPKSVGEEFVGKAKDTDMRHHADDADKAHDYEPEPEQPTVDEGPMREFLKGKGMDDASIEEAVKLMHPAKAEDESEEEREEGEDAFEQPSEEEEEKKGGPFLGQGKDRHADDRRRHAKDKHAKDRHAKGKDNPPPFTGMPKPGGAQDKAAMDALKEEVRAATVKQMREVRAAEIKVEPHVGRLAIAHDTAADVFKTALGILGIAKDKLEKVPASAYEAMFDIAPKPSRTARESAPAMDQKATDDFHKRYPGAAHIRVA
jgi:hypothetical protein